MKTVPLLAVYFLSALAPILAFADHPVPGHVVAWNYVAFTENDLPANLTNIIAVSATASGNYYSRNLALKADGTVIAWGKTEAGQRNTNVPVAVKDVVAIAAGEEHYLALKKDGTVFSWQSQTLSPVPANVTNVSAIAAGDSGYSLALTKAGAVLQWGGSSYPVPAGLNSNVVAIAAGNSSFLALKVDGTVVTWGLNNVGQLNVPASATNLVACATDFFHGVGLKADGTVISWGHPLGGASETNIPTGLNNIIAIAAGGVKGDHVMALKNDGRVVTWGVSQTSVPGGLSNVVAIAAGDYYNLAIVADHLQIADVHLAGQKPAITFHTFAGQQYAVESRSDCSTSEWSLLGAPSIPGTGHEIEVIDTNLPAAIRFYRLKQW